MEQQQKSGAAIAVLVVIVVLCILAGGGNAFSTHQSSPHVAPVIRLSQLDPSEYASQEEYSTWAPSACSTTSMTEVLNTYGANVTIHQVLQVERSVHAISATEGLLDEDGLRRTVEQLGYHAAIDHTHSLEQVIELAGKGTPVIVSIPPLRSAWFPGGHILVVTGGNTSEVFLVDSSSYNMHSLPRQQFQYLWSGLTAVITPSTASTNPPENQSEYQSLAEQDARDEGIPADLFRIQINDESGFQVNIVSPVGAIGIAQFMPEKAKELGIDPHDPVASLRASAHLMATYLKRYGGDYAKALAAYEAGPGTVDRAVRLGGAQWTKYLPASTCRYIHTIMNEQVC